MSPSLQVPGSGHSAGARVDRGAGDAREPVAVVHVRRVADPVVAHVTEPTLVLGVVALRVDVVRIPLTEVELRLGACLREKLVGDVLDAGVLVEEHGLELRRDIGTEVPDDRLRGVVARGEFARGEEARVGVTRDRERVERAVLVTDGILLGDLERDVGRIQVRAHHRVVHLDGDVRVVDGRAARRRTERHRPVAGEQGVARRVGRLEGEGDARVPLHVVVRLVDLERVGNQRHGGASDVDAKTEIVVADAEEVEVAEVVARGVELQPLAVLPLRFLVLLVEVRRLAVEVDAVLEVDVARRPRLEDRLGTLIGRRRDLHHGDHLELVLRDPEADVVTGGDDARPDAERTKRVGRRHLVERGANHPARILRAVRCRTDEELLADVLVLVEDAVSAVARGDAAERADRGEPGGEHAERQESAESLIGGHDWFSLRMS